MRLVGVIHHLANDASRAPVAAAAVFTRTAAGARSLRNTILDPIFPSEVHQQYAHDYTSDLPDPPSYLHQHCVVKGVSLTLEVVSELPKKKRTPA